MGSFRRMVRGSRSWPVGQIVFDVLSLVGLLSFSNLHAAVVTKCYPINTEFSGTYCLTEETESNNQDLLYFFHGLGGDQHTWESQKQIYEIWKKYSYDPPRVVAISFGGNWVLAEKNEKTKSGLYEVFVHQVMDRIEQEIAFDPTARRLLVGASMGGFNASQLLLKEPQRFHKVALLCPALTSISPYSPLGEVWDYIFRTGANAFLVDLAIKLAKEYFPNLQEWNRSSPLDLAKSKTHTRSPPIHISCGSRDEFGFHEGSQKFASIAQTNGATVRWQSIKGKGHCAYDVDSIAAFMILP